MFHERGAALAGEGDVPLLAAQLARVLLLEARVAREVRHVVVQLQVLGDADEFAPRVVFLVAAARDAEALDGARAVDGVARGGERGGRVVERLVELPPSFAEGFHFVKFNGLL